MDESVSAAEPSWVLDGLSSTKWQLYSVWGLYSGDQVAATHMDYHDAQSESASKHTMTIWGHPAAQTRGNDLVGYGPSSATGTSSSLGVERRETVRI